MIFIPGFRLLANAGTQNLKVCVDVVGHGDVHEEWSVLELRAARV